MDEQLENSYIVYTRRDCAHEGEPPRVVEEPLAVCDSYAEARELQRRLLRAHQEVVIRFEGITGGGD